MTTITFMLLVVYTLFTSIEGMELSSPLPPPTTPAYFPYPLIIDTEKRCAPPFEANARDCYPTAANCMFQFISLSVNKL